MKIAIIGAIEGTLTRRLEKDYVMFVRTLREFGGAHKDIDVHLLQPTDHDCLDLTIGQLNELNVVFTKNISNYNQSFREFNYTNKPIACEWFYDNISSDYDYFLWLDGDVIVLRELVLPTLSSGQMAFIHNDERVEIKEGVPTYVKKSAPSWVKDQDSYRDMISRVGLNMEVPRPTNSWYIMTESTSEFWREWNNLTRFFIDKINDGDTKKDYLFAKEGLNFENRVEELTMDLIINRLDIEKVSPINAVTYNTPDAEIYYNEDHNKNASLLHYDDIDYLKLPELKAYISNNPRLRTFVKKNITELYGIESYKGIFLT